MQIYIKGEDENGNEIEFYRSDSKQLIVSVMNGHGTAYYYMDKEEIEALIDYIKITDERI